MRIIIYLENLLENMCLDMLDNSPTERYSLNGNFWLLESTTWTQTDLIYSKIMQKILMLLRLSEMTGNNKYSVEIKYLRQKIVRLEEILKKEEKDDVYESVKQVMLQMVDSMGRHPSKHQEYKQEI